MTYVLQCEGHFCCLRETKVFKKHTNVFFSFFFLIKMHKVFLSGRFRFRVIENAACTVYITSMECPHITWKPNMGVCMCVFVLERERGGGEISG